ncbi:MAG: alpha/beta fold hydrolase [Opitutales bacterium]
MVSSVSLNYRYFGGEGRPPLVILHGLLGSSRNWTTTARDLADHFEVFALDLRNHGDSPHAAEMSYDALVADLVDWLDARDLDEIRLMGHSLGGKVAMLFACRFAQRVDHLYIADIAPKPYEPHHRRELDVMTGIDLRALADRKAADAALAREGIDDWAMRQFLLTNLQRDKREGGFRWQVNLPVLRKQLPHLADNPLGDEDRFPGPTLFIRGDKSDFIEDTDTTGIQHHFPRSRIAVLENCGHNVHVERREAFVEAVLSLDAVDWGCSI